MAEEQTQQQTTQLGDISEDGVFLDILFGTADNDEQDQLLVAAVNVIISELEEEDDEEDREAGVPKKRKWGGSEANRSKNKSREFDTADSQLRKHCFNGEDSVYNEVDFLCRFGLPRAHFCMVYEAVKDEPTFRRKYDAFGRHGITALCCVTSCMRYLVYRTAADREDEYLQLSETVVLASIKSFTRHIIEKFSCQYLNRSPTMEEKVHCMNLMARSGFPGIFGSIDCKHFVWIMCPLREAGAYKGKERKKTIILETITDREGYFWFTFFGEPGSLNDLNILNKSTTISSLCNGTFDLGVPKFQVGTVVRDFLAFLGDGIYPEWSIFVRTISAPINQREAKFAHRHEFVRKDVERGFGQFVKRFQCCDRPFRFWYLEDIIALLNCCLILQNMSVEYNRGGFVFKDLMAETPEAATPCAPEELRVHSLYRTDPGTVAGEEGAPDFASKAHKIATVYDNMVNEGEHREYQEALLEHISNEYRAP